MALVARDLARLTISMIDRTNTRMVHSVQITGDSAADRIANAQAYVALWEAVTLAEVVSYSVAELYAEDTVVKPTDPAAISSVKASVTVALAGLGDKKANLAIPAPIAALFTGSTNNVNTELQALIDLVAAYTPANYALISDGETVRAADPIISGKRVTYYSANP